MDEVTDEVMDATETHTPPGPRRRPIVGDSMRYLRDPLKYLLDARRQYGGLCRLPLAIVRPYLASDPALVEKVLVTENKNYIKDMFLRRLGREVLGQGLLTSEGDFWRRQRRLAQPAFHRERIAAYADIMTACAQEYVKTLQVGQTRDLHKDMMQLTLRIVSKALFHSDVDHMAEAVGHALEVVMNRYGNEALLLFPFMARLPLPTNLRFRRALHRLDEVVLHIIQKRRAEGGDKGDLLSMLLSAQDEDGTAMTDAQLRDEVLTIFSAGHETTALVLSYALLLLSRHRDALHSLQLELSGVLSGRPPTFADLPMLRYTEAVVLETLRIYPPAWALGRETVQATELGGYEIAAGEQVWISPWVMHRDERFFPSPELFLPARWLDGLQKRLPRFAYLPFGGGPRLCIGNSFAITEAVLVLAAIAGRFSLHVLKDQPLNFLPTITLRPRHPLRFTVEEFTT